MRMVVTTRREKNASEMHNDRDDIIFGRYAQ